MVCCCDRLQIALSIIVLVLLEAVQSAFLQPTHVCSFGCPALLPLLVSASLHTTTPDSSFAFVSQTRVLVAKKETGKLGQCIHSSSSPRAASSGPGRWWTRASTDSGACISPLAAPGSLTQHVQHSNQTKAGL